MMGSLFFVTYLTSIMVVFEGGQAAGAMLNKGFFQAIPAAILVIASTVSVGFLEPLLSAPLYAGVLGLNIFFEYQDTYGLMYKEFMHDGLTRYIFVWPPFSITSCLN